MDNPHNSNPATDALEAGFGPLQPNGIRISAFAHRRDNRPQHLAFANYEELGRQLVSEVDYRETKEGPLFSGAEFHEGATRANRNVAAVHATPFDLDDVAPEVVTSLVQRIVDLGWACTYYSTYSHDPSADVVRFRVVVFHSRPLSADEYHRHWFRLADALEILEVVDHHAKDAARINYLPSARTEFKDDPHVPVLGYEHGAPVDVDAILARALPLSCIEPLPVNVELRPHERGAVSDRLCGYWRARLAQLCAQIEARPYPGQIYDLKNGKVFGLAQGAPHIVSPEEIRSAVRAALTVRNPGLTPGDQAVLNRAFEQVDVAIKDGMAQAWWPEPAKYPFTDTGNAERLVDLCHEDVRWVPSWQRWIAYDPREHRWSTERGPELVLAHTKEVARRIPEAYPEVEEELGRIEHEVARLKAASNLRLDEERRLGQLLERADEVREQLDSIQKFARGSENIARRRAMMGCATSEPLVLLRSHRELDVNPFDFNAANCTIDLRDGMPRDHRQTDLITKLAPVVYDFDAKSPTFDQFLREIFLDDEDLVDYVLRCFGYSLTGDIREHCLFVCHGTGANGKTTLMNAVHSVMGDYAMTAPPDLLTIERRDSHPTGRAALFKVRLCTTREIEEGRNLNEAEVKELTGGDPILARRMREDYWQFDPTHKLFMATNHLPNVRGSDHGIWRRIRTIPFDACFRGREDKDLAQKLATEKSGILGRLVRACVAWQDRGLEMPARVASATEAYRQTQDPIAPFLEQHFEIDPSIGELGMESRARSVHSDYRTPQPLIWRFYKSWSEETGMIVYRSARSLYAKLRECFHEQRSNGVFFCGLRLRATMTTR